MLEEGNPTVRKGCPYHWASNAPTAGTSLIHGMPWTFIADTARRLEHDDPRNHKSMSFTERGDQAAGILRQHDTLGVLALPGIVCSEHADLTICK